MDALHASAEDDENEDLHELEGYEMELPARDIIGDDNQAYQQREQEYGYRIHSSDDIAQLSSGKMNKFNFDSFDRDSDLLDENDLIEL